MEELPLNGFLVNPKYVSTARVHLLPRLTSSGQRSSPAKPSERERAALHPSRGPRVCVDTSSARPIVTHTTSKTSSQPSARGMRPHSHLNEPLGCGVTA
jgi:hypothetical protein